MSDPYELDEPAPAPRKRKTADAPFDPFAPPEIDAGSALIFDADTDTEELRRAHLNTESNIKAIGVLTILGGLLILGILVVQVANPPGGVLPEGAAVPLLIGGAIGLAYLLLGVSLLRLDPRSRIPALVVFVIVIVFNVLGTLIGAGGGLVGAIFPLIFALILGSSKAKTVLSPAYRDVIAQTPHIRQKLSCILWAGIILFAAVVILGVVAVLTSGARPQ